MIIGIIFFQHHHYIFYSRPLKVPFRSGDKSRNDTLKLLVAMMMNKKKSDGWMREVKTNDENEE